MPHLPSRRPSPTLLALVLAAGLAACAAPSAPPPTLYDRLGGAARVTDVVSRTVDRAASDPRTRRTYEGVRLSGLKDAIAGQICAISGGGCLYKGERMREAHSGLNIAASEFDALVTMLREELDRAGVDDGAKNDLLRLLAPMKRDIVAAAGVASHA